MQCVRCATLKTWKTYTTTCIFHSSYGYAEICVGSKLPGIIGINSAFYY